MDWASFSLCSDCEIKLSRVARLGEAAGVGEVDGRRVKVIGHGTQGFAVYEWGSDQPVLTFREDGSFGKAVGRPGVGPREFRFLGDVVFNEQGQLLVRDFYRAALLTFNADGSFAREVPLRNVALGPIRILAGDTLGVVGAHDRRPSLVGQPLHLIDVRSGNPLNHFGAADGARWVLGQSFYDRVMLEESGPISDGRVWWAETTRPHFEEWSVTGQQLRSISGVLEWFEPREPVRIRQVPPVIITFAVDRHDQLWILSKVLDHRWRQVRPQGPEGAIPPEASQSYFDARLDIFDLEGMRQVGTRKWDSPEGVFLVEREGDVFVSQVEIVDERWPQVVLYVIDPGSTTPSNAR